MADSVPLVYPEINEEIQYLMHRSSNLFDYQLFDLIAKDKFLPNKQLILQLLISDESSHSPQWKVQLNSWKDKWRLACLSLFHRGQG